MSVLVCGKRSPASFFEDEYHAPAPKRTRRSDPLHFSWPIENLTFANSDKSTENQPAPCVNLPSSGSEWVELVVRETLSASSMDDARARASRVLEELGKSIAARAAAGNKEKEEQVEKLLRESEIWKRGFKTLHQQKDEFERCSQELQLLKHTIAQREEELKKLQMENYGLKLRLASEQRSSPMPARFHPDIFG